MNKIYLAGGCFWGVQAAFDLMIGVEETAAGYCAGHLENPSYEEVCEKTSGHAEAISVTFNPEILNTHNILDLFFKLHDPYQKGGQGNDTGPQYRSGVYWEKGNEIIHEQIKRYFLEKEEFKVRITTEFAPISNFWQAEEYHQKYLIKNPSEYCHVNMNDIKNFLLVKRLLKK
jgi:methionine-S-sulfoxide reductase